MSHSYLFVTNAASSRRRKANNRFTNLTKIYPRAKNRKVISINLRQWTKRNTQKRKEKEWAGLTNTKENTHSIYDAQGTQERKGPDGASSSQIYEKTGYPMVWGSWKLNQRKEKRTLTHKGISKNTWKIQNSRTKGPDGASSSQWGKTGALNRVWKARRKQKERKEYGYTQQGLSIPGKTMGERQDFQHGLRFLKHKRAGPRPRKACKRILRADHPIVVWNWSGTSWEHYYISGKLQTIATIRHRANGMIFQIGDYHIIYDNGILEITMEIYGYCYMNLLNTVQSGVLHRLTNMDTWKTHMISSQTTTTRYGKTNMVTTDKWIFMTFWTWKLSLEIISSGYYDDYI